MASVAMFASLQCHGLAPSSRCRHHTLVTCSTLHTAQRPSRSRRCFARVFAFRWGKASDTTTNAAQAAESDLRIKSDIPSPPTMMLSASDENRIDSSGDSAELGETDSVDKVMHATQREEQVRDMQRFVLEAMESPKAWWRDVPDKRTVLMGAVGLVVAAYIGSAVLDAVDRVPLVPRLLKVVGFGYSVWFWWRFVLFAEGRAELRSTLGHIQLRAAERWEDLTEKTSLDHDTSGAETGRAAADDDAINLTEGHMGVLPKKSWDDTRLREEDQTYPTGPLHGPPGRGPSIFAFSILGPDFVPGCALTAPEMGPEEISGVDDGAVPYPKVASGTGSGTPAGSSIGSISGSSSGTSSGLNEGHAHQPEEAVADLDPCLGWDTEACIASGHLKLGVPDNTKLEALAEAALRHAQKAVGFSRHVDEVLHEPTTQHGRNSTNSVHFEGEYGRAAGTMEREVMEDLAKNPAALSSTIKSNCKPAVGESAGTGP